MISCLKIWWFFSIYRTMSSSLGGLIKFTMTSPHLMFQPHLAGLLPLPLHISASYMTCHFQPILTLLPSVSLLRYLFCQEDPSLTCNCLIKYYASFKHQLDKPQLITVCSRLLLFLMFTYIMTSQVRWFVYLYVSLSGSYISFMFASYLPDI